MQNEYNGRVTRREWFSVAAAAPADVHQRIRSMADQAPLSMRFQGATAGEARLWQAKFSARLRQLLGPFDPPARWTTTMESAADFADHRRETLILESPGVPPLPVHLLRPRPDRPGKRPAMAALHGHGRWGHDPVAGIATTEEQRNSLAAANYDYGLQLARRGYVVAAPCFTPFGRRLDDPAAYGGGDPCGVTFVRMQLLGRTLISENLRDALWAVELLARQPEVDAARIGCAGLSYGGRMTMLASALSPRIRAAVISGALNLMQERILGRYSCGAQVIPGLLEFGDVPEIIGLIAPRPCVLEIGQRDALMVKDRIGPAMDRIRAVYAALGAADKVETDSFDGGHRWNGAKAYPMLSSILRP